MLLFQNSGISLTRIEALDLMCVDPAHQYRGIGTMLMEWGTDVADRLNVEVSQILGVTAQS